MDGRDKSEEINRKKKRDGVGGRRIVRKMETMNDKR